MRWLLSVASVAVYIVACWLALAVAIVLGALADVLLFDRFYALVSGLTSAEQARWLWAGGLGFSLACYACGIYRAAGWFAMAPQLKASGQQRARAQRPEPLEPHEIPKTGPSPDEIMKRGMPRG